MKEKSSGTLNANIYCSMNFCEAELTSSDAVEWKDIIFLVFIQKITKGERRKGKSCQSFQFMPCIASSHLYPSGIYAVVAPLLGHLQQHMGHIILSL